MPLDALAGSLCAACLAVPPEHDGVHAAVAYADIARNVALALKYARRPGVARTIAALLGPRLPPMPDALLVPVPLHRWRLWSRGFNQSLAIARALAAESAQTVRGEAMVRTRATPVLRGMTPQQRRHAVKSAFRAIERFDGRDVVLVDDVYTTGATANACARVLKRAGARRVIVATWARVVADGD